MLQKWGAAMEWGDIRVFLGVARAGQMAGASKALGMDHSTISRRIARLEEQTGVPCSIAQAAV